MLIPRFTTRTLLLLTAVCGVLSAFGAFALRGEAWALALTLSVAGAAVAFACYGFCFAIAWVLARLLGFAERRPRGSSPFATAALPPQIIPPEEPE